MEGNSIYFFKLGFYNVSDARSTATRLTKTSTFVISKNINEILHTKIIHVINKKKLAKNTDSFLGKSSYYGSLSVR